MTTPVAMAGDAFPLMKAGSTTIGQNNQADWAQLFYQGLLFSPRSTGGSTFVRRGVLHRGWRVGTEPQELKVLELGNGPNVQVNPGLFVVQKGDVDAPDRGTYWGGSRGTTPFTVNMPAAPGANTRYDAVYACIKDKNVSQDSADAVANNGPYIDVRSGVVGASLNINGVSGTAGAPPVTPDGYLPIAFIPRATNDNTIDQASIVDVRRGAMIAGTPRVMFPWDITNIATDVGVLLGEERYRPASGVYPAFVDRWDGTTWRGTGGPVSFAQPAQTASGNLGAGTSVAMSGAVVIPWPGFPYKINALMETLVNSSSSTEIHGEINVDSNTYTAPSGGGNTPPATSIGWDYSFTAGGAKSVLRVEARAKAAAITDGNSHSITAWVFAPGTNGSSVFFETGFSYKFAVEIVPA